MEIFVYNTELTLLGVIDEIFSLIWTKRYWSVGSFSLLVPFTSLNGTLLTQGNLLMKRGDHEAMQISYVSIRKNAFGIEEMELQGQSITAWLHHRIILQPLIITATSQGIMERIVRENVIAPVQEDRSIPLLEMAQNTPALESDLVEYTSEPFLSCQLAVETVAKAAKIGFCIETDVRKKRHTFRVYKGKELTADQTEHRPCIFSQEFDNIYEQEYQNSVENLRSVGYVGGEEKDGEVRQIVQIGDSSGLERREIFINATDITRTYKEDGREITLTLAEYRRRLEQRGIKTLEQFAQTLNFSSKVNLNGNLTYKTDFDLGDRVTCVDKKWGVKINVRITEITQSYQQTSQKIDVTFGESLPTLFDKINQMR